MPFKAPFALRFLASTAALLLLAVMVAVLVPLSPLSTETVMPLWYVGCCTAAMLTWYQLSRSRREGEQPLEPSPIAWLWIFVGALVCSMGGVYADCGTASIFGKNLECDDELSVFTLGALGMTLISLSSAFRAWFIARCWP